MTCYDTSKSQHMTRTFRTHCLLQNTTGPNAGKVSLSFMCASSFIFWGNTIIIITVFTKSFDPLTLQHCWMSVFVSPFSKMCLDALENLFRPPPRLVSGAAGKPVTWPRPPEEEGTKVSHGSRWWRGQVHRGDLNRKTPTPEPGTSDSQSFDLPGLPWSKPDCLERCFSPFTAGLGFTGTEPWMEVDEPNRISPKWILPSAVLPPSLNTSVICCHNLIWLFPPSNK